eukprot:gnl/TRDRNA2_/TRDRNA2_160693_c0_seq2.p1 gnl/TRDRNA2_/TRDRNA2_160693_c0~~gnl/TRDRNA2_/TRDRNA2_160693_c0_seq2.p1  ORF type:complete len:387 (+),score=87.68 gnl/TRDRNA2_/TRDRNA2_160693_c0_seq2:68-1228(+)
MGASTSCPGGFCKPTDEHEFKVDGNGDFVDNPRAVAALRKCCEYIERNPWVLEREELSFMRDLFLKWGAEIPVGRRPPPPGAGSRWFGAEARAERAAAAATAAQEPEEEASEDEPEPPDPDRWPEDRAPFPPLAPQRRNELTDDEFDRQAAAKEQAVNAAEARDFEKALQFYSEAIGIGDVSALVYARRAEVLLRLRRPLATVNDCTAALQLNPDCGKAFRIRGIANRHLGRWKEAHEDLAMGQKLDYDDATLSVQQLVDQRFARIHEKENRRRLKAERKVQKAQGPSRSELEEEARLRRFLAEWTYEAQNRGDLPASFDGQFLLQAAHEDPDLVRLLENPRVQAALSGLTRDPQAMDQYQNDAEVMKVLQPILMGMLMGAAPGIH